MIFILIFNSCKREIINTTKGRIDIVVLNNYFEKIDSICVNKQKIIDQIESNERYNTYVIINNPLNKFEFYTHSNLKITADIYVKKSSKNITITINRKGKILIN